MKISSSKVSGMVNFLSTVNIGKLSKKKKSKHNVRLIAFLCSNSYLILLSRG